MSFEQKPQKRPGGEMAGRAFQKPDGTWRNKFGEVIPEVEARRLLSEEEAKKLFSGNKELAEKMERELKRRRKIISPLGNRVLKPQK